MCKRTEDDPIHVGDVALMAELQVDDVVATDPECEIRKIHDCPDPGDAFDHRGDRTHCGGEGRSNSPPTLQSGADKARSTHSLVKEYAVVMPPMMD